MLLCAELPEVEDACDDDDPTTSTVQDQVDERAAIEIPEKHKEMTVNGDVLTSVGAVHEQDDALNTHTADNLYEVQVSANQKPHRKRACVAENQGGVLSSVGTVHEQEVAVSMDTAEQLDRKQVPRGQKAGRKRERVVDNEVEEVDDTKCAKYCRRRWSADEKDMVFRAFGQDITNKTMPSGSKLEVFLHTMKTGRTVAQLRTFIHNYISGKTKF